MFFNLPRQLSIATLSQIFLSILGCLFLTSDISLAQVTSDDTVNTQVNQNGNVSEITGGERAGDNLFHSFQDFSVDTGNEASFLNANDIANIFSRVTGGNISNIDGLISANGSANLFLINPAGILFGENARLDVGGSFYGSTADSILFEDGEFSATDLNNPPVLTVNAPIGLNLRDNPGNITVRGDGQGTRTTTDLIDTENALRVDSEETLALVGGKINLEGATIKTTGGRIELGSLEGNQQVGLTPVSNGFGLDYAGVQNFQDIQLSKTATIDASGLVAGDIQVRGNNISLTESSQIEASTIGTSLSQKTPGSVEINAIDTIKIDGRNSSNDLPSGIFNQVYTDAVGDAGKVTISSTNLALTNGGAISASTFGEGNGGNVLVNVSESITLDDSSIQSAVDGNATGNGGNLNITTPNLSLNGSSISTDTFGQGNGGLININATESITLDSSSISSTVSVDTEGNGGELNITTPNLSLTNFGSIDVGTLGQGNGGSIDINATESITLDSSSISSTVSVDTEGNGGELNITTPNLSLNDSSIDVDTFGRGDGGELSINTANLSLTNGGSITGDTFGQGNAGSIGINATESITLDEFSSISSSVTFFGESNGGNLNITTPNLFLTNSSSISTDTRGQGDGGLIDINAPESITLDDSSISSTVSSGVEGNGGNIQIATGDFSISNNARVDASTSGIGNGGEIDITANNFSLTNGGLIFAGTSGSDAENIAQGDGGNITIDVADTLSINGATTVDSPQTAGIFASNEGNSSGNAGNIDITASKLSLINGGQINSFTRGTGNGGNTTIDARDSIFLSGKNSEGFSSAIFNSVEEAATGNGGIINIATKNLSVFDSARITASSRGQGDAGKVDINANVISLDNGEITARAFNNANGGNLAIDTDVIVASPNGNSDIVASAEQGQGGNITIDAESLFGIEERPRNNNTNDINASSDFGLDGNISIFTPDVNSIQRDTDLPANPIESEQTVAEACRSDLASGQSSDLIINGKGGIPPQPIEPMNSDATLVDGRLTNPNSQSQHREIKPIKTSVGDIYPARGVIVRENGDVILTAYPTDGMDTRTPNIRANCS
jgi:filamentous hemagglutinin family protein